MRRALEWLGLIEEGSDAVTDYCPVEFKARRDRFMEKTFPGQGVLVCRDQVSLDREKEMIETLRKGRILVVDLREIDLEPGQRLLDRLCGALQLTHGRIIRIAPAVFLAVPNGGMLEIWEDETTEDEEVGQ